MIRCTLIALFAAACGPGPKPAPVLAARATEVAPPVDAAVQPESDPAPDEAYRGALCFGHQGPTDIRAFDDVAIRIFESSETVTEIGTCRLVEGPSHAGYREITIMAGTAPVAVLNLCGGKALVAGINYGRGGMQIGDSTARLASVPNLECSADVGGYWCYAASEYDPIARFLIAVPAQRTASGTLVQGPAAVALLATRTIAGASFTTRCD